MRSKHLIILFLCTLFVYSKAECFLVYSWNSQFKSPIHIISLVSRLTCSVQRVRVGALWSGAADAAAGALVLHVRAPEPDPLPARPAFRPRLVVVVRVLLVIRRCICWPLQSRLPHTRPHSVAKQILSAIGSCGTTSEPDAAELARTEHRARLLRRGASCAGHVRRRRWHCSPTAAVAARWGRAHQRAADTEGGALRAWDYGARASFLCKREEMTFAAVLKSYAWGLFYQYSVWRACVWRGIEERWLKAHSFEFCFID